MPLTQSQLVSLSRAALPFSSIRVLQLPSVPPVPRSRSHAIAEPSERDDSAAVGPPPLPNNQPRPAGTPRPPTSTNRRVAALPPPLPSPIAPRQQTSEHGATRAAEPSRQPWQDLDSEAPASSGPYWPVTLFVLDS